ncbi:MAG: phosphoribosylamine--glycine ligase [Fimbriimonadaceae bacterium]|nr:phosphoribosylamine--glycine ligase [Fimbriimonadaceae bacterium]
MKILVLGAGGREHGLAWKLSQEAEVFCAPGNPGIAAECPVFPDISTVADVVREAQKLRVDFVVVGPEDPLIAGVGDALREVKIPCFGPGREGAQLEASKAWSKAQMAQAGVPTALAKTCTTFDEAEEWIRSRYDAGKSVAVKASGAALGKGVVVANSEAEALISAEAMLSGSLGEAGKTLVIEDRLVGFEFSLLTVVSGRKYVSLPVAQDYKRIFDGDKGPNTGGMGTYSPVPHVTNDLVAEAEETIVLPLVEHLANQGIDYRGVLFSGVMVEEGKPLCLEYNVRFGDPETQTVVRRLGPGFAELLRAAANGESLSPVPVLPNSVVTVVLASEGYPGSVEKGRPIQIGSLPEGVKIFHAGTSLSMGQLVTNGGRVLAVSAEAESLESARTLAYEGVGQVQFAGMQSRSDVACLTS